MPELTILRPSDDRSALTRFLKETPPQNRGIIVPDHCPRCHYGWATHESYGLGEGDLTCNCGYERYTRMLPGGAITGFQIVPEDTAPDRSGEGPILPESSDPSKSTHNPNSTEGMPF